MSELRRHAATGSCLVTAGLILALCAPAGAITVGRVDTFQRGILERWTSGGPNPNPPVPVADAGPRGVGDFALLVTSTGSGAGGHFVTFNASQWSGDYQSAGVEAIALDVSVLGPAPLILRAAVDGPGGRFASTTAFAVAPGTGFQRLVLSLTSESFESVGGVNVSGTLGDVTTLRLVSSAAPSWRGDPIVTQALFDNIRVVPEPSVALLLAAGVAGAIRVAAARSRRGVSAQAMSLRGATLYSTLCPCLMCTKMTINAGIGEVVFGADYPLGDVSLRLFREAGLKVRQVAERPLG